MLVVCCDLIINFMQILEERMSELSRKQRHLSTGETRQFDYRPVGEKNPIFSRLGEKDRSKKLLEYACFHKADLDEADKDKDGSDDSNKNHDGTSEFDAYSHKVLYGPRTPCILIGNRMMLFCCCR